MPRDDPNKLGNLLAACVRDGNDDMIKRMNARNLLTEEVLNSSGEGPDCDTDYDSLCPLQLAAVFNRKSTCKLLLDFGADIDAMSSACSTRAIVFAVMEADKELTEMLAKVVRKRRGLLDLGWPCAFLSDSASQDKKDEDKLRTAKNVCIVCRICRKSHDEEVKAALTNVKYSYPEVLSEFPDLGAFLEQNGEDEEAACEQYVDDETLQALMSADASAYDDEDGTPWVPTLRKRHKRSREA